MLDLKLFSDLQGDATASLLLRPGNPGNLCFFVIAASVNYSVVVAGECIGELPGETPLSFDVVLSSITPLLNKNYKFKLSYIGGTLKFTEENDKFTVTPLFVEHISPIALDVVQRYLKFSEDLNDYESSAVSLEELSLQLKQLEASYSSAKATALSGFVNDSNPWGVPTSQEEQNIDEYYSTKIAEIKGKLSSYSSKTTTLTEIDLSELKRISLIASRNGTTISMCDDYAIVDLNTAYVLQKVNCGVRSVQGKLLRRLLIEPNGKFFDVDGSLVFVSADPRDKDRSSTVVFFSAYLPSTQVDSTIVTGGAVLEKYKLNIKSMLSVLSVVSSKFTDMVLEMGTSTLRLTNDRGEELAYKFEVEDAKTVELNKLLRGESAGEIKMSNIVIPKVIQRILPLLDDDFTLYVKKRKVILQSRTLYVVFGK